MGAFSRLRVVSPVTGKNVVVQFKHGQDFQREYKIGDAIEWIADSCRDEVREFAGGIEPPCSAEEPDYFKVIVMGRHIVKVEPIDESEHDRIAGIF